MLGRILPSILLFMLVVACSDETSNSTDAALEDSGETDASDASAPVYVACVDDSDSDAIPDSTEGRSATGVSRDGDLDGTPDYMDVDSDDDLILDSVEWHGGCEETGSNDRDVDAIPDYRDADSDADGIPDRCEARAHAAPTAADLTLALLDTDADLQPDYLDRDSDGDWVRDASEDANGDCVLALDETDRLSADSDGDGTTDFPEVTLGSVAVARDVSLSPATTGKAYFVAPYDSNGSRAPTPASLLFGLSTKVETADVTVLVDTRSTTASVLTQLSANSSALVSALGAAFTSPGLAVAAFSDVPCCGGTFGTATDSPFSFSGPLDVTPISSPTGLSALTSSDGADVGQSALLALASIFDGRSIAWTGGSIGPWSPPTGRYGALSLRSSAVPFFVVVTGSPMHGGLRMLDASAANEDAAAQLPYTFASPSSSTVRSLATAIDARILGVALDAGARGFGANDAYGYLAYLAQHTGAVVPPGAFPGATCKTGLGGATIANDGALSATADACRLVMSAATDGVGAMTAITNGLAAMQNALDFDVFADVTPSPGSTDVVDDFIASVAPLPAGGTDPITASVCVTFSPAKLRDDRNGPRGTVGAGDVMETIDAHRTGSRVCFSVVPKPNSTIPQLASTQVFRVFVNARAVSASRLYVLGSSRELHVLVPPLID